MPTPSDVAACSTAVRIRVIEMLRSIDPSEAATPVPACPGWTVHDVVRHLYGVADDVLTGRLDGVASDEWTQAQIDRHAVLTVGELCEAWDACGATFDVGLVAVSEPRNLQAVMDLSTHEHDLRHALDRPGAQQDASVSIGRAFVQRAFERRDPELFASFDELGFDDFEVMRTMTGRRSARQLRDADVDADRVVAVLGGSPFRLATVDIVERD